MTRSDETSEALAARAASAPGARLRSPFLATAGGGGSGRPSRLAWNVLVLGLIGSSLIVAGSAASTTIGKRASLTVSVGGRGKITSKPRGISCPGRCRVRFARGSRVRLVARAVSGWKLTSWGGACAGRQACSVTLSRSKAVRATFRRIPPPPPPPPPPPRPLLGTGGLHSTASLNTVGVPVGLAVGFGSVWLRAGSGWNIVRIDAARATISAGIEGLPTAPQGFSQAVAAGEGAIWTANIYGGSVSRIDPATNRVVATIPVWHQNVCGPAPSTSCSEPTSIAFTPGAVWVALHHEWAVVRIDPATNTRVATIPVGFGPPEAGPSVLAAANGYVYVAGGGGLGSERFLKRIDPATNAVTPVIELPTGCDWKAAAGTHVWIGVDGCFGEPTGSIADIDSDSGSIIGRVALGGTPLAISIGAGSVWASTSTNELIRIDPTAHAVTGRLPFPALPARAIAQVAIGGEDIWLAVQSALYHIGE